MHAKESSSTSTACRIRAKWMCTETSSMLWWAGLALLILAHLLRCVSSLCCCQSSLLQRMSAPASASAVSASASSSSASASASSSGSREVDRGNRGIPKATFIVRFREPDTAEEHESISLRRRCYCSKAKCIIANSHASISVHSFSMLSFCHRSQEDVVLACSQTTPDALLAQLQALYGSVARS
jgi:hypothetical protein